MHVRVGDTMAASVFTCIFTGYKEDKCLNDSWPSCHFNMVQQKDRSMQMTYFIFISCLRFD